jgi:SAM-dependent methyltransferase
MRVGALPPYEQALRGAGPLALQAPDGRTLLLDIGRWLAPVDHVDETVLARCAGPALDVGCGPGRFVASLAERGVAALGVDIAETAVALTRDRGLPALLRDVFDRVPGEGRWPTVLLMDGNIGIGGDPLLLLARIRRLLAPAGHLLVETDARPDADERLQVCFSAGLGPIGPPFGWALLGAGPLRGYARTAGYRFVEEWSLDGRTFVVLSRTSVPAPRPVLAESGPGGALSPPGRNRSRRTRTR